MFEGQIKSQALFHVEPPKSKAMYMERGLSGEASFHKPVLRAKQCIWKPDQRQGNMIEVGFKNKAVYMKDHLGSQAMYST